MSDNNWICIKLSNYFGIFFNKCPCASSDGDFKSTESIGKHMGCSASGWIHVFFVEDEEHGILPSTLLRCDQCGSCYKVIGKKTKSIDELVEWVEDREREVETVTETPCEVS